MIYYDDCYEDERPKTWCELCGHPHAQKHRIRPGIWGGAYDEGNIALLCPNHHAAIHFLMVWYLDCVRRPNSRSKCVQDDGRLMAYMGDGPLWKFWNVTVKPVVIDRLRDEGRWHPYVRKDGLVTVPNPRSRKASRARGT